MQPMKKGALPTTLGIRSWWWKGLFIVRMPICQTCFSEVKFYDSELKPEVSSIKSSFVDHDWVSPSFPGPRRGKWRKGHLGAALWPMTTQVEPHATSANGNRKGQSCCSGLVSSQFFKYQSNCMWFFLSKIESNRWFKIFGLLFNVTFTSSQVEQDLASGRRSRVPPVEKRPQKRKHRYV